ncbi:MAG TPA: M20/M25/M40 family metallo-hydrolase [Longimicrobiales bacterium]|nr:M20/M25/M40 family metallo-hydrolase [Longimicrobiales bacterium]
MKHASSRLDEAAGGGDPVALARALVATPSVNPALESGGHGEKEIAELTAHWLEAWGFRTRVDEVAPGRCNVVASLRGVRPGPRLLLNGHLDTVGVRDMTVPAFDGDIRDGRLIGRGASDMKGGVAAALATAATLARTGLPAGELVVALTADEEHASLGMAALVEGGPPADAAVVCEPTGLAVMPAHKGFVWVDLLFRGRAAHGSRPELGIDAVRHAALFVAALDDLAARLESVPSHPLLGHGSLHVGTIRGGTAPSVYPHRCSLTLERRTLPGEAPEDVAAELEAVLEELRARIPRLDATLETGLDRPGTEVAGDSALVRGLLEACERCGRPPRLDGMTAWVDAAFLNLAGVPAVCFGPGGIEQAHSVDEWCDVAEIEGCTEVLTAFALGFLTGDAGPPYPLDGGPPAR